MVLAVLVILILCLSGRKESRLYDLWLSPPDLRLFLENSGREEILSEAEGVLVEIRERQDGRTFLVRTAKKDLGLVRVFTEDTASSEPPIGSRLRIRGRIFLARTATNPGEFDLRGFYDSENCFLVMREASYELLEPPVFPLADAVYRLRKTLYAGMTEALSKEDASFLAAFLLGIRDDEFETLSADFQDVLMLRVLLQSGFHLTLFAGVLERLLKKLMHRPLLRAFLILFPCLFYTALGGFRVSFIRALLVCGYRLFAPVCKRKADLLSGASLALALLLIARPRLLFQSSFLYLFAVLAAFYIAVPLHREFFRPLSGRMGFLLRLSVLQAFLTPVQICTDYTASLYAPLISLILMPLAGLVLSTGFPAAFLYGFSGSVSAEFLSEAMQKAGLGLFGTGHYVLRFYRLVQEGLRSLPGSFISCGKPPAAAVIACCVLLLLPSAVSAVLILVNRFREEEKELRPGKHGAVLLIAGYFLIFLLEISFLHAPKLKEGELRILMLDVGQGDCFLISSREENVLIDCGSSSREEVGSEVLIPALKYYGIDRLDSVVLTHGDLDHVNGIPALLDAERIHTVRLILGNAGKKEEYEELLSSHSDIPPILYVHRGMRFEEGFLQFDCLAPLPDSRASGNDASVVLLLSAGGYRALFTGDISAETEESLIPVGPVDFLKAAHHGSEYSSSEALLTDLQARTVWISCGRNNSYGHPGKGMLERSRARNMEIHITAEEGAVSLRVIPGEVPEIRSFTVEKRKSLW